jgi:hypothetical protein
LRARTPSSRDRGTHGVRGAGEHKHRQQQQHGQWRRRAGAHSVRCTPRAPVHPAGSGAQCPGLRAVPERRGAIAEHPILRGSQDRSARDKVVSRYPAQPIDKNTKLTAPPPSRHCWGRARSRLGKRRREDCNPPSFWGTEEHAPEATDPATDLLGAHKEFTQYLFV